jgi:hypothetical protein
MTQSSTLESFFSRDGELEDVFREVFPVWLGNQSLEYCSFEVATIPDGFDYFIATFRVVTWDTSKKRIEAVVEEAVLLDSLAPAVENDVYLIEGVRIVLRPETVKTGIRRFVRGLPREVRASYARLGNREDLHPGKLFSDLR